MLSFLNFKAIAATILFVIGSHLVLSLHLSPEEHSLSLNNSCFLLEGFPDRDFAASGIYCELEEGSHQLVVSESLKYEVKKRDGKRYELRRLVKSKRDLWVGIVMYSAFVNTPNSSLEDADWYGHALTTDEGSIDSTESKLNVTFVEVPLPCIHVLSIAAFFSRQDSLIESSQNNASEFPECFVLKQPPPTNEFCSHYWTAAAQIAELGGNHLEAAHRYGNARSCIQDQTSNLTGRYKRWRIAEISHLMAKSFILSGMMQPAYDEVLVGLDYSPERRQRRILLLSLGDLRLAFDDTVGAMEAYNQALQAVLLKGGMVEKQQFWSYFPMSVGDFIAQIVSSNEVTDNLDISFDYAAARINMLLSVEI